MHRRQRSVLSSVSGVIVLVGGLALAACGDDGKAGDTAGNGDTSGDAVGDTHGDVGGSASDASGTLPTGCWLPATASAPMDCALMCDKIAACGAPESDCLDQCALYEYVLAESAGPKVEECFVDAPCTGQDPAFTAIACVRDLADDITYLPPAGNKAACDALSAKLETCSIGDDTQQSFDFTCEMFGAGLSGEVMGRAAPCADKPCNEVVACIRDSSCIFRELDDGTTPVEIHDGCIGEGDANAIGTSPVYETAIGCGTACQAAPGATDNCEGECMVDGTAVSADCGTCFGRLGKCVAVECKTECADEKSAACFECQSDNGCDTAFADCAGIPVPGSPSDANCNPDDRAAIASEADVTTDVATCVEECADGATCADECMEVTLGVSGRCAAGCGGDLAICAAQECATDCDDDDQPDDCWRCLKDTDCYAGFEACSGFAVGPAPGALCEAGGDPAKAADGSAFEATVSCVGKCASAGTPAALATCLDGCVGDDAGVSDGCGGCYADLGACVAKDCAVTCADRPDGSECYLCMQAHACLDDFHDCAGVDAYVAPQIGTGTCGAAVDCAAQCASEACLNGCLDQAAPAVLDLAERTAECVRTTCKDGDPWCHAQHCLADYQACYAIEPAKSCVDVNTCAGECADEACVGQCFDAVTSVAEVDRYLAIRDCVIDFCAPGGDPDLVTPECQAFVVNDPSLCLAPLALCADPETQIPARTCREISVCTLACQDPEGSCGCSTGVDGGELAKLNDFYQCVGNECPSGDPDCVHTQCFASFAACYGEGENLPCDVVYQCFMHCDSYTCLEACRGAASSGTAIVDADHLYACVVDACDDGSGHLVSGCEEAAMADNESGCHPAAQACYGVNGCVDMVNCLSHCLDGQCVIDCEAAAPAPGTDISMDNMKECLVNECTHDGVWQSGCVGPALGDPNGCQALLSNREHR